MGTKEKQIILEDVRINGEWFNQVAGEAIYEIESAEKGLRDSYGQLITPNCGARIICDRFEVKGEDVLSQLSREDVNYIYTLLEKDLEYA